MRISVWRSDVCSSDRLGMRVVPSQVKVLLLGAGGGGGGAKGGKGGSGGSGRGGGGGAGNAGKTAKSGKQAKTAKPRKKRLRERLMGRTTGKQSKTGSAVQDRLRTEGQQRENTPGGTTIQASNRTEKTTGGNR